MKKYILIAQLVFSMAFTACSGGQNQSSGNRLQATGFAAKIKELPDAPVIDVRTPDEFFKGHLPNAVNIDWNGDDFENRISALDKTKPVFVYCLSGARSAAAAEKMRAESFVQVYELAGGIMKWRGAGLPETTDNHVNKPGITKQQFDALVNTDKQVLVDFYADWCGPCKKMKPYLEEISQNMAGKVTVIRINADDNQQLCKELKIDALPVLQLYKNHNMVWTNAGYIGKDSVILHLE